MPSIILNRDILFRRLKLSMTDEQFSQMLFDYGLELDDIINDNNIVSYKIDIPANRYDLLCLEGLVMALRAYKLAEDYEDLVESDFKVSELEPELRKVDFQLNNHDKDIISINKAQVIHQNDKCRKFIACATINGINFDADKYESFIEYQDKLHLSIGRNRSIVAIGTHDMSHIQFPIFYKCLKKEDVNFQPLNIDRSLTGQEIINLYSKDTKMKKYCKLISDDFPCFIDANGTVLSLPPLINSEYTKITQNTKSIFIEVTGNDEHKVNTVLKMILYNFRGRSFSKMSILKDFQSSEQFCINICGCEGAGMYITPYFMEKSYTLNLEDVNKKLGLSLKLDELYKILVRMMHTVIIHGKEIIVRPSDVRSDVIHYVDILEDIAIAFGYNKFARKQPKLYTVGLEDPFIKFADIIRLEMVLAGYNELLTLSLMSKSQSINNEKYVSLLNPNSSECEIVRNSLLPGILKAIHANQHVGGTIKSFEVSDVVIYDTNDSIINQKNLCVCYASKTDGLDHVLGLISLIMAKIGLVANYKEKEFSYYFEKRSAEIIINEISLGSVGVINPEIINSYRLPFAISSAEINLNALYKIYKN